MVPETASKFAHIQGQRPPVGIGRWATRSAKLLGAATVTPCSPRLTPWPIRQTARSEWHSCTTLVVL
jgi:hypothetical protein